MAARHEEGCYEKKMPSGFFLLLAKETAKTMTSGRARGAVVQEVRPGAGFKTSDFVNERLGGGYLP